MTLRVLQTLESPCGYFEDRLSRNLVVDPSVADQRHVYDSLAPAGFRRAGDITFRPHCQSCSACVPCRVPVLSFRPNRRQRRSDKRNRDLDVIQQPARFTEEHFALYRGYLAARHTGGSMDNPQRDDFERFLLSRWAETWFIDFRLSGQLLATAVCDRLENGLSAVYSFFDPLQSRRSLGVHAVLTQIRLAAEMRLQWLYLGYWIEGHPKMHYKASYQPLEVFRNGRWRPHPGPDDGATAHTPD